ncbi:MAG: S49 family peptidase [Waddliaceae bacterium]
MRELVSSSLLAFFTAFFAVIGFAVGIIASLFILTIALKRLKSIEKRSLYKPVVLPDAQGVRKVLDTNSPIILQVNIEGVIGGNHLNMGSIKDQLIESREGELKNARVKAIILNIHSPGGTVNDSHSIYENLKEYKKRYGVPIYAYVDGLCASGGMYVAAAADAIYCRNSSLIGSIGVISFPYFNVSKTLNKWGVDSLTLSEGKGKDNLNPFRPWRPDEDKNHRDILRSYYKNFVNIIVENRPITQEALIDQYGAKIFTAEQAKEAGLVDQYDLSLADTIKKVAEAVGLEDEKYQVVQLKSKIWYPHLLTQRFLEMIGKSSDTAFYEKNPFMYL